ncbi:Annexin D8 [Morus notabilis]|uniref:Annexin D8 n=1 Tax=Morus notabilis TaxID=981085 RepID=W9R070_9ROSA|nr:annexin D8 [Morus notabilis]EXB31240.1 Annexin D8 [Morus notabilis]
MLTVPSYGFEHQCKEIHDSWGQLNRLVLGLAMRTRLERQQIRETYKAIYGEDLVKRLQDVETSGISRNEAAGVSPKLCAALPLWMLDMHECDAVVAREALQQDNTNYKALVEIFVGRKSSHILLMKQEYQARFKRQLDQDIINIEPPNPYQKILVALVASHKAHHLDVSNHIAKCDAKRLYETGEGSPGAIERGVVLEILSKRSVPQLKLTFSSYKRIYGHDYTASLKRGDFREFENALGVVAKCIYKPPNYYAKTLYGSIKGITGDKAAIERVMVSRAEVDMDEIQRVYKKKYGIQLRDALSLCENIPSTDYRDFLVALATKMNELC